MKKFSLFLLLSCVSFILAAVPPSNTFVLKDTAAVSDNIVRIRDVALMDNATRERIGNLVIAVSPEPGKTDSIPKNEIYQKLIGNGIQSPRIEGADSVKIVREGTTVQPSFFKEMLLDYITRNSKWKDNVSVEIVSAKPVLIPESGVRWELRPANGQDFFGNILFHVSAYSKETNDEVYSNWIVAKLKIVKEVAVSNRTIQKNEIINDGVVRWETREIDAFTKDALFNREEIIGEKAGRIIRPNSVITSGLLGQKFLVTRGGMATLVARLNSVKATSTVKVLSNGSMGDSVQVINTASQRILTAVVTGKNMLEVNVQ
jgi:flagella basal body P-ring formation protein FlgA